jgi:hypothetical protein
MKFVGIIEKQNGSEQSTLTYTLRADEMNITI